MLGKILEVKAIKKGVGVGKKVIVKVDEKTQLSKKVKDHKKEILVVVGLFSTGFTIGYFIGRKKRKKSLFYRIQRKKKIAKAKRELKMAQKALVMLAGHAHKLKKAEA